MVVNVYLPIPEAKQKLDILMTTELTSHGRHNSGCFFRYASPRLDQLHFLMLTRSFCFLTTTLPSKFIQEDLLTFNKPVLFLKQQLYDQRIKECVVRRAI